MASDTTIRLLDGTREVARHARSYDAKRQIECPAHFDELAKEKRRARELRGRDRVVAACPNARTFLERIALHGGHLGGTTARLLRLLDQYGPSALNRALAEATERTSFSAHSVAHILERTRRATGTAPIAIMESSDPRVRDTVVVPHALDDYDVLAHEGTGHDE